MTRRIARAILVIVVLAVTAFALPLAYAAHRLYHDEEVLRLERVATAASRDLGQDTVTGADPLDDSKGNSAIRLAVYDGSGQLDDGDGPATDPIVEAALSGRVADGTAGSDLVVAIPVGGEDTVTAVVRAAINDDVVEDRVRRAWLAMAGVGLLVVLAAAILALFEGRRLARPVKRLSLAATRLGGGDFTVRVERSGVAEIDEAASAVEATAERLGGVLDRERSFSADASHQLRTPVTSLRLGLESALAQPGPVSREALERALGDVDHLETTIDDLLLLARDATRTDQRVVLDDVLPEIERSWHGSLAAAGRPLRLRIDPGLDPVSLSEAALRQVLDVLLSNAAAHGRGAITIGARSVTGGVAVDVDDEGSLPPGDHEALFVRRSPDATGTGIGLALARSLAEAEGARLVARTHDGHTRMSLLATTA